MATLTLAATEIGDPLPLESVVERLRLEGHNASVGPTESKDPQAPNARLVVRLVSDEDGAGLARTAKHVVLAVRDATGQPPSRMAVYDRTGRLLNDTDSSLR